MLWKAIFMRVRIPIIRQHRGFLTGELCGFHFVIFTFLAIVMCTFQRVDAAQLPISLYHLMSGTHGRYLNKIEYADSVQYCYYKGDGTPKAVRTFGKGYNYYYNNQYENLSLYDFSPQEETCGGWSEQSNIFINTAPIKIVGGYWDQYNRTGYKGYKEDGRLAYEDEGQCSYFYDSEGRLTTKYWYDYDKNAWCKETWIYDSYGLPNSRTISDFSYGYENNITWYSYYADYSYSEYPYSIKVTKDYEDWAEISLEWEYYHSNEDYWTYIEKLKSMVTTFSDEQPQEKVEYIRDEYGNLIQEIKYIYNTNLNRWEPVDRDVIKYDAPSSYAWYGYKWSPESTSYDGWEKYEEILFDDYGNISEIRHYTNEWSSETFATLYYVDKVQEVPEEEVQVVNSVRSHINNLLKDKWSTPSLLLSQTSDIETNAGVVVENGHIVRVQAVEDYLTGLANYLRNNLTAADVKELFTLAYIEDLDISNMSIQANLSDLLDGVITNSLNNFNCSQNLLSGNLGIIPIHFPNLKKLYSQYNNFESIYPPISKDITVAASYQEVDKIIDIHLGQSNPEEIETELPQIFGDAKELCLTPASWDDQKGRWAVQLIPNGDTYIYEASLLTGNNLDYNANLFQGKDGDIIKLYDKNRLYSLGARFHFIEGDANFDGLVDVADLQSVINHILYSSKVAFNFTAADTYQDKKVNVQDVVVLVDKILESENEQEESLKHTVNKVSVMQIDGSLYLEGNDIVLDCDSPVAALSLKNTGNIEWALEDFGFVVTRTPVAMVAYSLGGNIIPEGRHVIGHIFDEDIRISQIVAVDTDANHLKIALSGNAASISDSVNLMNIDDIQIYGSDGIRRDKLCRGLNIVIRNGKSEKVIY